MGLVEKLFSNRFRFILVILAVLALTTMVLGNLVAAQEAGSSCPDWPTCLGSWLPPVWIHPISNSTPDNLRLLRLDYAHRAAAGLTLLGLLLASIFAVKSRQVNRLTRLSLIGALALILGEIILSGTALILPAAQYPAFFHLLLAYLALGLVVFASASAFQEKPEPIRNPLREHFARLSLVALILTLGVIISGSLLAEIPQPIACSSWPWCAESGPGALLANTHRLVTILAAAAVGTLAISAWKHKHRDQVLLPAATAAATLLIGQIATGAVRNQNMSPAEIQVLHAAATAGVWAALALVATWSVQNKKEINGLDQAVSQSFSARERIFAFFMLTKPLIVLLLLVTTFAGMVVGAGKFPPLSLIFTTLLGGALAAGGSSAVNQYLDRDLDKLMQRTEKRPIPSGKVTPAEGMAFGLSLCLAAFFLLAIFVNMLSALLSLAGMIYYIVIYSLLLKRVTVQNIVIGGGAGAIPPLVGWAAATGSLNVPSLFLFAIIFLWTPPHFWALAIVRQEDYAHAGIPMLPVVQGELATRKQIFIYTLELVGITLILPLFGVTRQIYLISAVVLGLGLIGYAWRLLRTSGNKPAWQMYKYSSRYLGLIFLAMVLDILLINRW